MSVNWQQVASLAELGGNIALNVLSAEGITPANTAVLAQGIEAAVNPLLSALSTGQAPGSTAILAGYGALIGTLNVIRGNTALAPEVLAKATEYIAASEAGITAYMQAQKGYDPALFTVASPIDSAS